MPMSGTLYIAATPIGNLSDVTENLKSVLESVDYILAEDTRVTLKLLNHMGIKKKLFSYHEHSSDQKDQTILKELQQGVSYALVSDAGTPGVSDPGARLVEKAIGQDISVVPVAGPSAVTTFVSVFGKPVTSFHFWGFFPIKKKKQRQLMEYFETIPGVHVYFESPQRFLKTFGLFLEKHHFHCVVGREMTKKFETFYRGTPQEVWEAVNTSPPKGEFCVGLCNTNGESKKVSAG